MLSFFEWLKQKSLTEIRVLDAHAQPSQSAERDIGRDANWTIACLLEKTTGWKVRVYPIGSREDVVDKVDAVFESGPHTGQKIQISRRIAMGARDDYQIPLIKNILPSDLTNNDVRALVNRSDSKFASLAKWFVMLNANDDKIFMSDIENIKDEVYATIGRMEEDGKERFESTNDRYFDRTNNVNIRVSSGISRANSLIAYVPAEIVAENIYDTDATKIAECETEIQQERERKEEEERQAAAEREAARKLSDIELAIKQTKDTGTASLKVVGNKNAIDTKLKKIRAAASANRIRVDVKPDGTVTLINM
jgi:hypothetical protein